MPLEIENLKDYNEKLEQNKNKLVVVDFYAHWCGPCKMIAPKLDSMADEYANDIVVFKVSLLFIYIK